MKTKIRTQESQIHSDITRSLYKHMHIQILTERYKGARYLEPMGEITFQLTVGDPDQRWYAMNFVINTSNVEYIEKMAKLAKFIKQNRSHHDAQPDEIKQLIGAEEHVHFDGEFVPVSDKGKKIFKVIKAGSLYDKITAANEIIAQKILDKKKIVGAELKFDKEITF